MTKDELQAAKKDLHVYQRETKHLKYLKASINKRPTDEKFIESALDYVTDCPLDRFNGRDGFDALRDNNISYTSDCADEHMSMADMEDGDDRKTDLQEAKECKQASNKYCDDPDRLDPDTPVTAKEALRVLSDMLGNTPKTITEAGNLEPDSYQNLGINE